MKIAEKKYYVCEKCGKTSQNEKKVKDCEASHVMISQDCPIVPVYRKGVKHPEDIIVGLVDGSTAVYTMIKHMEAQQ